MSEPNMLWKKNKCINLKIVDIVNNSIKRLSDTKPISYLCSELPFDEEQFTFSVANGSILSSCRYNLK